MSSTIRSSSRPPLLAFVLLALPATAQTWPVLGILDSGTPPPSVAFCQSVDAGGDLDGDSVPDVLVGLPAAGGGTAVVVSGASGSITTVFRPAPGERLGGSVLVPGDLDGDGRSDVVLGTTTAAGAGRIEARSSATGALLYAIASPVAGRTFGLAIAASPDLDGDGVPDLVAGAPAFCQVNGAVVTCPGVPAPAGNAYVFSGATGALLRTFAPLPGASASTYGVAVAGPGDLDGDTVPDFIVATTADHHGGPSPVEVVSGATGTLIRVLFSAGSYFPAAFASPGDVNADGVPEIAAASRSFPAGGSGTLVARTGLWNGASGALLWSWSGAGAGTSVDRVGDVDGDGIADLVTGGGNSPTGGAPVTNGRATVLSGATGAALSTFAGPAGEAGVGTAVAGIHDLDGDGRPDFVTLDPLARDAGRFFAVSSTSGALLATLHGDSGNDLFGLALDATADADGDGRRDLVVGLPRANGGGLPEAGAVRVVSTRTGAVLRAFASPVVSGHLGAAVADLGDVDGDGTPDVAAGAPAFPDAALPSPPAGRVVVFSGATGSVVWSAAAAAAGELYGYALARLADQNGDGVADLAIGAPSAAAGGFAFAGRVEVRSGSSGALLATVIGTAAGARLGAALADVGDIDGDAVSDWAAGATQGLVLDLNGAVGQIVFPPASGPGYVEIRSGANGALLRTLAGTSSGGCFGQAVAPAGDADADGRADVVVGAPCAQGLNAGLVAAGRATVFSGATGAVLTSVLGAQSGFATGYAVAPAGDVDADGRADFAVSAPGGSFPYQLGIGYVDVVSGATGATLSRWKGTVGGAIPAIRYGRDLVRLDDLDGNGIADLAASSPAGADTAGATGRGHVEILSPSPAPAPPPITPGCVLSTGGWLYTPVNEVVGAPSVTAGNPLFGIRVKGVPVSAGAILGIGLSTTTWNGVALPLSLAPYGYGACTLDVAPDVVFVRPGPPASPVDWNFQSLPLSAVPGLAGLSVYAQWLVFNPFASGPPGVLSPAAQIVLN